MTLPGNVLVVDDEKPMYETYCDILIPSGYRVEWAPDRASALARLQAEEWDVVLLDQRLNGLTGGNTGIELVSEISQTGTKVILVTAYADPDMAERAFREGAYDYLTKDNLKLLRALLRIKVASASELARERRLSVLSPEARDKELLDLWRATLAERDPQRKGKLLEEVMVLLFKTIPGFANITPRARNKDEEIDLLIRNESTDPFWSQENSQYILVECKNWSKPVGTDEFNLFRMKIARRAGRSHLGFFVALGGFTEGFHSHAAAHRPDGHLVVTLERSDLEALITARDRNEQLKRFHERAAMAGNGH